MSDHDKQLESFRRNIDALDIELIDVLARRFAVVKAVGQYKSGTDIAVVQPVRAQAVKDRAAALAADKGIDEAFIRRLYEMMIDHAHDLENAILSSNESAK